jgi:outer membrane protein assembly factor BamD
MGVYPDSEYAPKAKYAVAYTWYKEGGTTGLASAELEFKDFLTFFPDNDLTDDAQLMVAMTHVRQLEKPDRDDTQARLAEYELSEMIRQYPDSPLLDEAKEKLRDVQEILAESIFGPARTYYRRKAYLAVLDRCEEILDKYPDFSGTDRVLFVKAESHRLLTDMDNAATEYARIVREYPASENVDEAKKRLLEMKSAIPEPDPLAINRINEQRAKGGGLFSFSWLFGGRPPVSTETSAATVQTTGELSVEQGK